MKNNIVLLVIYLTIVSCNKSSNFVTKESENSLNILNDSINIFKNVQEFTMNKKIIENDSIRIIYYSIPKNDFLSTLNRNKKNIQFFNKEYKFNEKKEFRFKDQLILKNQKDSIRLIDLPNTNLNRPVKYFMQGKIGNFYIVKKIHFEDAETFFYNIRNLKIEKKLWGITSSYNRNKSIVFYINNFFVLPEEKSQLSFLHISENNINYMLNVKVDWFTNFSFFDNENNLYYIHSFYDENMEIKSTYAKMEYHLKN